MSTGNFWTKVRAVLWILSDTAIILMSEFALADRLPDQDPKSPEELLDIVHSYFPDAPDAIIMRAFEFSKKAHEGQIRRSGEPYIFHPLAVAGILAHLKLDVDTIVTGLLHDAVEDTLATIEDIKKEFGETVAFLVDGVTKISKLNFKTSTQQQGENIRKMIVAMGKDVRVILVKLADRLHNMRTLNHMPYAKQARIAQETLEIYAPLASRLGLSNVKVELEDLSFKYYLPDMYYELSQKLQAIEKDQGKFIEKVKSQIAEELKKNQIHSFQIQGRMKHLWSIYKKIQSRSMDLSQIYDILAFRVIVDTVPQCYAVLGLIHALWKPIPGRFKDFIAMPKANGYQSLHTTVVGPNAQRIEIQIRTHEMHQIAEKGIAAHWKYKEGRQSLQAEEKRFHWLRSLLEWQQTVKNSEEFLDTVKTDLFDAEIYVFTPKGDIKEFPDGASVIDFAYSVHTDVGHHCVGAKVNGRMVPIRYQLKNGDTVEILTSPTQKPSKDWLKICVTNRAKSKIRSFVKDEQRHQATTIGRELLEKEFRKYGSTSSRWLDASKPTEALQQMLKDFGIHKVEELLIRIGYGRIEPKTVVERLAPELLKATPKEEGGVSSFISRVFDSARKKKKAGSLIKVDGYDDMLIHFARCCNPLPGDPIVGFITRGRGISVHRSDCPKTFDFDADRKVEVEWNHSSDSNKSVERTVKVQVVSLDSKGLLKDIAECFSANQMNIEGAQIHTTRDHRAICTFSVSAQNANQLSKALSDLQKLKGTIEVKRLIG
jgi:guanosine-3',5'-bis(diphosphate) 3'-pyrophosphohydrolase